MSLRLEAACKLSYWSECLRKNASAEPSTKEGIEAARFCAFTPPGSSLDRHSVVVFPLTMNKRARKLTAGSWTLCQRFDRSRYTHWHLRATTAESSSLLAELTTKYSHATPQISH